MTFARNLLRIRHDDGFGIEFKAIDALKEVQDRCEEKVHASEEWIKAREQHQESQFFNQNFDWTFTTQYVGTLLPSQSEVTEDLVNKQVAARRVPQIERVQQSNVDDQGIQIQPSSLSIDLNKLKVQEEIMFFDEIDLFEDELADNGVSKLNVRIVSNLFANIIMIII